jgi:hypothetical protein
MIGVTRTSAQTPPGSHGSDEANRPRRTDALEKGRATVKIRSVLSGTTLAAAAFGAAGVYADATPLVLAATGVALASVVGWVWAARPHNPWAGLPRRGPADR